ncbi:MAG: sulfur reduction protein DsrS [Acidiferrobacterales bacterium]
MELCDQDLLRLNVLLSNPIEAIRVDEQNMTVHGLYGTHEARVKLSPSGRPEQYLRYVRELLSGYVLGSPGGYPAFLQRWTRMGQARDARLAELLMLGEPEAVVAVAGAAGLTDELARRAWWAMPTPDNARCMLARECVVQGSMGRVLAEYLTEYLPFETEPLAIIATVRLVLQPGLIDDAARRHMWEKGRHQNIYQIGFLEATPDALPDEEPARPDFSHQSEMLEPLARSGNQYAAQLLRLLDRTGQSFMVVSERILQKPATQEAAICVMNAIGGYFRGSTPLDEPPRDMNAAIELACMQYESAAGAATHTGPLAEIVQSVPLLKQEILALLAVSQVSETMLNPIFSHTTAVGTVMRKKIEPLVKLILQQYAVLRARTGS